MGRTLKVPKAHTSQAGQELAGDLTVTYAANDMVASLQQTVPDPEAGVAQVRKQVFGLDGSDRISTIKGYTDSVQLTETLNHYDSDSDSPAWTQTKTRPDAATAWATTWNRYISDLGGGLAIDVDNTGKAVLQLSNLHGDIVATTTLGQAGIDSYTETDEYGQPTPGTPTGRYSWLGTHQRDTSTVGGLTLMGARLYNPTTGLFLSIDPVAGGNDNPYTYPPDPINKSDLDGRFWGPLFRFLSRALKPAIRKAWDYMTKPTKTVLQVRFFRYPNAGGWGIRLSKNFRIDYHRIRSLGNRYVLHYHRRTPGPGGGIRWHRLFYPINGKWKAR